MLTIEQVKVFTLSPAVVRLIAEIKTARLLELWDPRETSPRQSVGSWVGLE